MGARTGEVWQIVEVAQLGRLVAEHLIELGAQLAKHFWLFEDEVGQEGEGCCMAFSIIQRRG